jgi:hypothetical protein
MLSALVGGERALWIASRRHTFALWARQMELLKGQCIRSHMYDGNRSRCRSQIMCNHRNRTIVTVVYHSNQTMVSRILRLQRRLTFRLTGWSLLTTLHVRARHEVRVNLWQFALSEFSFTILGYSATRSSKTASICLRFCTNGGE